MIQPTRAEIFRLTELESPDCTRPILQVTIFKTYSEENCLLECRAKSLLERCNCIPYYYPRLDLLFAAKSGNGSKAQICDWNGLKCLSNSSGWYSSSCNVSNLKTCFIDLLYAIRPPVSSAGKAAFEEGGADCKCPSSCSRTTYTAATSSAKFPNKGTAPDFISSRERR